MVEDEIVGYIHCQQCSTELPPEFSIREWARLNIGPTADGDIQIWCVRHDRNVGVIDRKTGADVSRNSKKFWVSQIPPEEVEHLRTDSKFLTILRLCRYLNQINFCMNSFWSAGWEMPPHAPWTPSGRRQFNNSIWFLVAVLHESFRVIPDLGKEFRHLPAYQGGFGGFFKRSDVESLKPVLRRMRNSQVFHVDLDKISETIHDFKLPIYVFSALSEDEQERMTALMHPHAIFFPFADEIAFKYLMGPSLTKEKNAELTNTILSVAGHFCQCGLQLIKEYRKERGWDQAAYDDYGEAYAGMLT